MGSVQRGIAAAAGAVVLAFALDGTAQEFIALKAPECLGDASRLYTTGAQYNDGFPANGVIPDSYSMLSRWQGPVAPASYGVERFTGLQSLEKRVQDAGRQDSMDPGVSPTTQVSCDDAAMLFNTWRIPHVAVVGGGYNDMYGYSWGATGPAPFRGADGAASDLVVQASVAVPWFSRYVASSNPDYRLQPTLDIDLFAYLKDTSHPDNPPIAILGNIGIDVRVDSDGDPLPSALDSDEYMSEGGLGADYPDGVFYASSPVMTSTRYVNTIYTEGTFQEYAPSGFLYGDAASAPLRFYRMHVSRKGLVQLVAGINNRANVPLYCPWSSCPPATAYSLNPDDYVVTYAGVIAETTTQDGHYGAASQADNDQVSIAVRLHAVGIYRSAPDSSFRTGVVSLADNYYRYILQRAADPAGRDTWAGAVYANAGSPGEAIDQFRGLATRFFGSREYAKAARGNADFVKDVHRALLGRDPEPADFGYWLAQLGAGMERDAVLDQVLRSDEYWGFTYASLFVDTQPVPVLD